MSKAAPTNHLQLGQPVLWLWLLLQTLLFVIFLTNIRAATGSSAEVTNLLASAATGQLQLREDLTRFPQGVAGSRLQVLEDSSGNATLEQIRSLRDDFQNVLARTPNYNFTTSAYWFRLEVQNRRTQPLK